MGGNGRRESVDSGCWTVIWSTVIYVMVVGFVGCWMLNFGLAFGTGSLWEIESRAEHRSDKSTA